MNYFSEFMLLSLGGLAGYLFCYLRSVIPMSRAMVEVCELANMWKSKLDRIARSAKELENMGEDDYMLDEYALFKKSREGVNCE